MVLKLFSKIKLKLTHLKIMRDCVFYFHSELFVEGSLAKAFKISAQNETIERGWVLQNI